jgi:nucleotide-binding universal stress UspA family protein
MAAPTTRPTILVATDLAAGGAAAVAEAARIAEARDAALAVVHVIDEPVAAEVARRLRRTNPQLDVRKTLVADATAEWRRIAEGRAEASAAWTAFVGDRATTILSEAERVGAALLVLGAGGESGGPSIGLGSVAARCVRGARRDVLLVRPRAGSVGFRSVLACVDLSPSADDGSGLGVAGGSRHIVRLAAEFARRDGASLELLHAYPAAINLVPFSRTVAEACRHADEDLARVAERDLRGLWSAIGEEFPGLQPSIAAVRFGASAGRTLIARAGEIGADLIVVGTHAKSGPREFLLGSVAERVLAGAGVSVLAAAPRSVG